MGLLQAQKRRDDAIAALGAAKNDAARKAATSELEAASLALATLQAKSTKKDDEPKKPLAEEDDEEEEEEEHEEEESDDEEEEEEESEEDDDDSDDDSDDDDDDDEEEKAEEEEEEHCKEKALASAKALVTSAKTASAKAAAKANLTALKAALAPKSAARAGSLRDAVKRITGKKSTKAMLGALESLAGTAAATKTLTKSVARLHAARKQDRVDGMLAKAQRAGKVTPAQVKTLRSQSAKWLKSYLATLPAQVRTVEEGALRGQSKNGEKDGEAKRAATLDAQNLSADERAILEASAASAGMTFDAYMAKRAEITSNGAVRRGA